ncbi:ATP-binding protein [Sanguibacter massiliensis]|uniref:ATP-binding protein n=1 Tax=Sanguibacter massiliensis TaxID=1973217 RepID=UPI00101AE0E6|nr:ATP-binding protein [Sanguibacter massiliensis]
MKEAPVGQVLGTRPAMESRAQRKARRALEREVTRAARAAMPAPEVEVDDMPRSTTGAWGSRTAGMWGPAAPALPSHRTTSPRLGLATPMLAESGLGHRGAIIGIDVESGSLFALDPWELYRAGLITGTSLLCIGNVGTGKSTTNKALASRLIALGRKVAVASDPKAEWVPVARAVGNAGVVEIGPGRPGRVNILDAGPRALDVDDAAWAQIAFQRRRTTVAAVLSQLRGGERMNPFENTALDLALDDVGRRITSPVVADLSAALLNPDQEARAIVGDSGAALALTLRRLVSGDLAGMFDAPSTAVLDPAMRMFVFDTSALLSSSADALAIASTITSAWLNYVIHDKTSKDFWMIVQEEGWSAMRDPKTVEQMDERVRMAGEWGIANMLIMHELKDLDMIGPPDSPQRNQALGLMSKAQVKIIHRQAAETLPALAATLGLTERERDVVAHLPQGHALWKIGSGRSYRVRTLITAVDASVFDTSARRAG